MAQSTSNVRSEDYRLNASLATRLLTPWTICTAHHSALPSRFRKLIHVGFALFSLGLPRIACISPARLALQHPSLQYPHTVPTYTLRYDAEEAVGSLML